jgi:hypothetical protein
MEIKVLGMKFRLEVVVISVIIGMIMGTHLLCSCVHTESAKKVAKKVMKEGLENMGASLNYDPSQGVKGSWGADRKVKSIAQHNNTHTGPKVPLPEGELFFFADNAFKPECCTPPFSGASSADGCACVTKEQVDYINSRGGNNVGPSQF